jgi:nitrite reductase/ring-hydroxylating ferredoxin subunit
MAAVQNHGRPWLVPTTMCNPTPPRSTDPSRRRVLGMAAAAGGGSLLLAACGAGGGASATTGAGGSRGFDGGSGTTLVATSKVPVDGGVVLDGPQVVVTQPSSGTFKAFTAVCTHQQCLVGSVKNGLITCPCHGSQYSATDGSVQRGPAQAPLKEISVTVTNGQIVEA